MEFPRHCHKPDGFFVKVDNQEQYDAVIANGWTDQPSAHVEKSVEVPYEQAITGAPTEAPAKAPPVEAPKTETKKQDSTPKRRKGKG